jgi:hypothetical protein
MDRLEDQWQPARMRGFRPWLAPGASPSGDSGHHFQIQEHGKGEEDEGKLPWGSPQPGRERRERSRGRPLSLCKNRGRSDWRGRSEQWCRMTSSVEWRGSEQRAPCISSWRWWSARLGSGASCNFRGGSTTCGSRSSLSEIKIYWTSQIKSINKIYRKYRTKFKNIYFFKKNCRI